MEDIYANSSKVRMIPVTATRDLPAVDKLIEQRRQPAAAATGQAVRTPAASAAAEASTATRDREDRARGRPDEHSCAPAIGCCCSLDSQHVVLTVDERECHKFRLGKIIQTESSRGLHFKMPCHQQRRKFPRQITDPDNPRKLFLTFEKKNLFVDFFVKWRIIDVGAFYRATRGDEALAAQRLIEIVKDGVRSEFAKRTVPQVVTAERRELLDNMLARARVNARELGMEVVDVRVKRTEFPEQVSDSVFDRMRQERARTASELRAQGPRRRAIRAEADRQRT